MTNYEQLERVIDEQGLGQTIDAISAICREKAEHLRVNWQDKEQAKLWDRNAKRLESAWAKLEAMSGDYCAEMPKREEPVRGIMPYSNLPIK